MTSKKQSHPKRSLLAPLLLLALSAASSSCGGKHGPKADVCIVDAKNLAFQCSSEEHKYSLSFEAEKALPPELKLSCITPSCAEKFLKACKQHQLLPLVSCNLGDGKFSCAGPDGAQPFDISIQVADNYVCLSKQDFNRVSERCK